MRNYEVTFIVDPTLPDGEIKSAAKTYVDIISKAGKIVFNNEMGLKQLAYPINKRNTGIYYCVEFEVPNGEMIADMELAMRRDENIMRFLTVKLDKYGVKYNEDKRAGKIGTIKRKKKVVEEENPRDKRRNNNNRRKKPQPPKDAPKQEAPKADAPAAN